MSISNIQKHLEEIYELIAGDDAINRFTPKEMIDYIKVLNEQIAEWELETNESFIPKPDWEIEINKEEL
jgi:hypothetical protein